MNLAQALKLDRAAVSSSLVLEATVTQTVTVSESCRGPPRAAAIPGPAAIVPEGRRPATLSLRPPASGL